MSILENFEEIVKLAKGESETQLSYMTQSEQDTYEMHVRAANVIRAGESLMKLVSDIKQYLILNDFPSVNEAITQNSKLFRTKQAECYQKLVSLRGDMAADFYDPEGECYASIYKQNLLYIALFCEYTSHMAKKKSWWMRDFRTCPDRPWGPPSLLYNGYRGFPGGKVRPGHDFDPSPSAVVIKR